MSAGVAAHTQKLVSSRCHDCAHFILRETEAQRQVKDLPKVTQLIIPACLAPESVTPVPGSLRLCFADTPHIFPFISLPPFEGITEGLLPGDDHIMLGPWGLKPGFRFYNVQG